MDVITDVITTCPLGSTCEEIKDNKIHQCAWYQKFKGTDAQGNETDDKACAIAWTPILMIEQIRGLNSVQAATESSRNETAKGLHGIASAMSSRPILNVIEGDKA